MTIDALARHRRRARTVLGCSAATAAVLLAGACTSTGATTTAAATGQTLNVGIQLSQSLDPATSGGGGWADELIYDPLIYQAPDGSLRPRLATSWNFVGTGNKVLELHLRPHVTFADGSALTAQTVRANLERYQQSSSAATSSFLSDMSSVDVVDPLTVRINMSAPNPLLPTELSEYWGPGDMVSEAGLAHAQQLGSRGFGAGPYELDSALTVPGDHYTLVPNPHYWNKSDVHYTRIVLKVLSNPNTALAALKTGQVSIIAGSPATDGAAKSAGLKVISIPQTFVGLTLADRAGKVLPALGDVRVRQALNYAVDRTKVAKGLVGTYGGPAPTEQIVLPGQDGYNANNLYSHNPAKAKQLLAQAGYANGFTLRAVSYSGVTPLLEVMSDELKAIGVHLQITDDGGSATKYFQDVASGKFPAFGITFGTLPVHMMGSLLFLPGAAQFNPFHSTDAQVDSLFQQAAAAAPADEAKLDQQIVQRLDQQAWFVPVLFQPVSYYAASGLTGLRVTRGAPSPDPVEWRPAT